MGVSTLHDPRQRKSVMWCNTDGRAFGPVFDDHDAADFLDWILADEDRPDPRSLGANALDIWVSHWKQERDEEAAA